MWRSRLTAVTAMVNISLNDVKTILEGGTSEHQVD